jgi:4-deoxy-L-threo-5-hexosulose-uronate ketol-isomerase
MQITETRRAIDPRHAKTTDTTQLRAEFLIDTLMQDDAAQAPLGDRDTSNERAIDQFVQPAIMESCQIVMGEPGETRHLFARDQQAVLSPPWSIHCGAGTASYSFISAMAGDNTDDKDIDLVAIEDLR